MGKQIWFGLFAALVLPWVLGGCGKKEEQPQPAPREPQAGMDSSKSADGYQVVAVENGGTISGKVVFKGKWTPGEIQVTKDQEACGKSKQDPTLLLSATGGVANAVVYISDIRQGKKAQPLKLVLDQKGCEYQPHVLAFPAGSTLEILNPDGILHNVHTYSESNSPINVAMPGFKKSVTVELEKPEIVPVKCDVHGWMSGWLFVSETPYFSVSGKDGAFHLSEVPPGDYTVTVWHEKLGKRTQTVKVGPGGAAQVAFEFALIPKG